MKMKVRWKILALLAFYVSSCSPQQPIAPIATAQIVTPETIAEQQRQTQNPNNQSFIQGESAVVIDMVSGRILYEKNARTQRPVASTQKLLTAYVVSQSGPLEGTVTISDSDTLVEPSKLYVKAGENYSRKELIKALLVRSGNDIALALARDVSGSKESFATLMNQTARSIGMTQSNFVNPHGLTETGQFSTALDLAILAREVHRNPFLRECMHTRSYTFNYADGRTRLLKNTNQLLSRIPYCTGMKTGTTDASGRCLVSSGIYQGRGAIAVVLNSTSAEVWNDSEKLLRWALENRTQ